MNEIKTFVNKNLGFECRITDRNGEPWFVAKDVCAALGIDTSNLSKVLDDDERDTCTVQYTDQVRTVAVVNEPGLYSLILKSRKPEAKAFKRWVTHEVLPEIRKTGGYKFRLPDFTNPSEAARAWAEQFEQREQAMKQIEHDRPKIEFYDAVTDSPDAISMAEVAKVLNIDGFGRNKMFAFLRERGVLMENNQPYQAYVDRGYFRCIEQKYTVPDGETRISIKTVVYQRGVDFIRRLVCRGISLISTDMESFGIGAN